MRRARIVPLPRAARIQWATMRNMGGGLLLKRLPSNGRMLMGGWVARTTRTRDTILNLKHVVVYSLEALWLVELGQTGHSVRVSADDQHPLACTFVQGGGVPGVSCFMGAS